MTKGDETSAMKFYSIGPTKYKPLPSKIYKARLDSIAEAEGKFGKIFEPEFIIQDSDYFDCPVKGKINQKADGKNGKICELFFALTGKKLDVFDQWTPPELIGKECFINVERTEKGNAIRQYIHTKDL